jgi:hypothetical protein
MERLPLPLAPAAGEGVLAGVVPAGVADPPVEVELEAPGD